MITPTNSFPQLLRFLFLGSILISLVAPAIGATAEADPKELVLQRYEQILLFNGKNAVNRALEHARSLGSEGAWPDIDYTSTSRSDWAPFHHARRLASMAAALHADDLPRRQIKQLQEAINRAIDYWDAQRFQSDNWWYNKIGVPRAMRDAAVLLRDKLPQAQIDKLLQIVSQYEIRGIGANLVWTAELAFHYACFTGDQALLDKASSLVWDEIKIGGREGIQEDWSFYQHAARLQTWHYGRSFLDVVSKLAWQLRETPWELPKVKRDIIDAYLINGAQWVARGRHASPAGLDRAVARPGAMGDADIRSTLRLWADVSNNRPAIEQILSRQEGQAEPLTGFRYFRLSDFAAYHQPAASILLKTISDRTFLTESINSENLLGWPYLSTGDHYVIADGSEYRDLPPVWDWSRLHGITTPEGESRQLRKDFSGGLGDGQSGVVAMHHARTHESAFIEVRKLWAFHDGMMYALLGGWNVAGPWQGITTSIEQCLLQGDVVYSRDGATHTAGPEAEINGAAWVLHNGVGYIPFNPSELRVRVGEQRGSWSRIRATANPASVTHQVLSIFLEHPRELQPSGYTIVLDASPEKLNAFLENPPARIVRNERVAQVIEFYNGPHMGAFYESYVLHPPWVQPHLAPPPEITIPIRVNRPGIAMWTDTMLGFVDPTHQGGEVSILWGVRDITLSLPADGIPAFFSDGQPSRTAIR